MHSRFELLQSFGADARANGEGCTGAMAVVIPRSPSKDRDERVRPGRGKDTEVILRRRPVRPRSTNRRFGKPEPKITALIEFVARE